eukprot:3116360-Rhodomonas_salina.4
MAIMRMYHIRAYDVLCCNLICKLLVDGCLSTSQVRATQWRYGLPTPCPVLTEAMLLPGGRVLYRDRRQQLRQSCYHPTHLLGDVRYRHSVQRCAMSGTDIAYGAIRCPVLT